MHDFISDFDYGTHIEIPLKQEQSTSLQRNNLIMTYSRNLKSSKSNLSALQL